MFDYLRDLTRSKEDKRQDALSAYLDGALPAADARRMEQELAQDEELRAQLAEMRVWRQELRALPSRRVPRNFTLDPATVSPPRRQPLGNAYPALRTATAMAAIMFVIALAALFGGVSTSPVPVPVAMEAAPAAPEQLPTVEAAQAPAGESAADAAEAPAAAMIQEEMAVEAENAEAATLRAKPGATPSPLDELMESAEMAPSAEDEPLLREAPPAEEMAAQEFAVQEESGVADEGQVDGRDAGDEVALANTLIWITMGLGLLLLALLILSLVARGQR